jgi:hypothetical protein
MTDDAVASTTNGDRQAIDVRTLRQAAEVYFYEQGRYPVSDSTGTWLQKLIADNYISEDGRYFGTTADGALPLDLYGQPLVYEIIDPAKSDSVVVRSNVTVSIIKGRVMIMIRDTVRTLAIGTKRIGPSSSFSLQVVGLSLLLQA